MRKVREGDVITYQQLDDAAQCNLRATSRHSITTARKTLRREDSMVFESVRNVGYRRLRNGEISESTWHKKSQHIRRTAHDGRKDHLAVKLENLPMDLRREVIARATVFHLLAKTAADRAVRNILPKVQDKWKSLPMTTMVRKILAKKAAEEAKDENTEA